MQRVQLLARPGGPVIAAGYLDDGAGGYRVWPAAGTSARWVGARRTVRLGDGREITLTVAEVRSTLRVQWLTARVVES